MKWREGHRSCREEQGGVASCMTNCVMQWSTRKGLASAATTLCDTTTLLLLLQGFGILLADDARRTPYYLAGRVVGLKGMFQKKNDHLAIRT